MDEVFHMEEDQAEVHTMLRLAMTLVQGRP
jgi:hypothetical protein